MENFISHNQGLGLRNAIDFAVTEPLVPRSASDGNEKPLVISVENEELWQKFAAVVFQGLVNRKAARIYLIWDKTDVFWKEKFVEMGYIRDIETADIEELPGLAVRDFHDCFDGLLVYDENILHTKGVEAVLFNIITVVAGKERLIPVPADHVGEWNLPVLFDARSRWESVDDAYQWVVSEYPDLIARGPVAHIHPKIMHVMDYMVAFNILPIFYWVGMSDKTKDLFEDILFSSGPNQPIIGHWHVAHHPGLAEPAGITSEHHEHSFVRHISSYGKYLLVIERQGNFTYHSSLSLKESTFRKGACNSYVELEEKVYITLLMSDGDNIWNLTRANGLPGSRWWGNPCRGQIHIAWTFAPATVDLMPGTLSYFYRTATEKDSFVLALGLGYMYSDYYAKWYKNRSDILREYFTALGTYMKKTDMRAAWLWQDANPVKMGGCLEDLTIAVEVNPQLEVIFLDTHRRKGMSYDKSNFMVNGVPVFHSITTGSDAKKLASEIEEQTPSGIRPAFMNIFAVNWRNSPETLAETVSALSPEYVVVGPETLGRLRIEDV